MMHAISISQKTWSRIIFWIQKISRRNKMLMKKHSACYKNTHSGLAINITDIIWCYTKAGDDPTKWKIVLANELIRPIFKWYHQVTGHPGSKRHHDYTCQRYYICNILRFIKNFKCKYCQRHNLNSKWYGLLPEHDIRSIPFKEGKTVHICFFGKHDSMANEVTQVISGQHN